MAKTLALRTQKNQVFELIAQAGLEASEFLWEEAQGYIDETLTVSRVVHSPTGFFFQFDFAQGRHYTFRSPGTDTPVDTQNPGGWNNQLGYVREWVDRLKEEYLAPDLWGTLASANQVLTGASFDEPENIPFSAGEVEELRAALHEISHYTRTTLDLTEAQTETFERRFRYLEEAAPRMGRLDWMHTFIGVFATIVMGLALAPEQAKELWQFSMQVLKAIGRIRGLLP